VNDCGDIFVLSLYGIALLVIAIKCPSEQESDLIHRQQDLGQVFDYLRINRECSTLGYCFGLWTTYDSCRLLWLNDDAHNALAQTEHMTDRKYREDRHFLSQQHSEQIATPILYYRLVYYAIVHETKS
jgi:hypothetical protein